LFKYITSGSGGEGLEMKGSDLDIMLVFKDVNVYEDISSARVNSTDTCVAMEMKDTTASTCYILKQFTMEQIIVDCI
jgi:hypothetical protein